MLRHGFPRSEAVARDGSFGRRLISPGCGCFARWFIDPGQCGGRITPRQFGGRFVRHRFDGLGPGLCRSILLNQFPGDLESTGQSIVSSIMLFNLNGKRERKVTRAPKRDRLRSNSRMAWTTLSNQAAQSNCRPRRITAHGRSVRLSLSSCPRDCPPAIDARADASAEGASTAAAPLLLARAAHLGRITDKPLDANDAASPIINWRERECHRKDPAIAALPLRVATDEVLPTADPINN